MQTRNKFEILEVCLVYMENSPKTKLYIMLGMIKDCK